MNPKDLVYDEKLGYTEKYRRRMNEVLHDEVIRAMYLEVKEADKWIPAPELASKFGLGRSKAAANMICLKRARLVTMVIDKHEGTLTPHYTDFTTDDLIDMRDGILEEVGSSQ